MTVPLTITVTGVEEIIEMIGGIEERINDLGPAFAVTADLLEAHVQATFETQGSRIGRAWQALAPKTVRARAERWGYYGVRAPREAGPAGPILHWSRRLRRSFQRGGVGHYRILSESSLIWGSGVRYAKYHQSRLPRAKIPYRPMLGFRDEFQRREILFQPVRMHLQGVPPGTIKTVIAPRIGLSLV